MIIVIIGVLITTMLVLFSLSLQSSIFIIALATLLGHLKPLREKIDDTKRNFLISVSVASFAISTRLHLILYNDNLFLYFQQKFIENLFMTLLVFPLITYTLWKVDTNKIISFILIAMLVLSFLQVYTILPLKTQPVNWNEIDEAMDSRVIPNVESTASFLMNNRYVEWIYYIGNGLNLKNSILGYDILTIRPIGIRGYCENATHHLIFIGFGVGIVYYSTDLGKVIADEIQFNYSDLYSTLPEVDFSLVQFFSSSFYFVKLYYFIFDKTRNDIFSVAIKSTWSLLSLKSGAGKDLFLKQSIMFSQYLNVTVGETWRLYISEMIPSMLDRKIEIAIDFQPTFNLYEAIMFYRHEIGIILMGILILELLREYFYLLRKGIQTS